MLFHHILVPYDGSDPSARALDKAADFVRSDPETRLTVAHVINLEPVLIADMTFVQPESYQEQVQKRGEAIIDSVHRRISESAEAKIVILAGSPAPALLDYAEEAGCDLIVMGSRGLSSLRELMVGSVSHNVILHSRIPVMVLK
ncbi:universal stress protein [Cohnella hongkongensis]|uniref:Universal stress protein n=1 Tax=Cohnella hongkongensis TaxID=178337 RepID=A0ABV9FGD1_9BACL